MPDEALAEPKRVLLLHSFGRDFGAWAVFARGFRAELDQRSPETVEFFDAALMTERFGAGQNEGPFVDYLQALFAERPLDLITAIGAPAARFLQQHRSQLFPSTPMVFAAAEQRRVSLTALTANDTVVAVSIDFASVVNNILRVLPETTDIAVVIGNSPNEQYWLEQIRRAVQPYTNQITFTSLNDLSFDRMLKRVATLPPKSAIFFYGLAVDAAGRSHEGGKALGSLRAVANAPIFTYVDTNFGDGIVGGSLISVNHVAQQTASVAMRILNGEAPGGIETPPIGPGTAKFDWRELQRWNISERQLPPGSEIWFRNLTLWEQYRWQIMLIAAAFLVQTGLIVGLLFEHRRRRHAEITSRTAMGKLAQMNRVATAGELSVSIAHEVNQPLAAIVNYGSAALHWLARPVPDLDEVRTSLEDIVHQGHHASEVIGNVRAMFKKDNEARAPLDINELVQEVLRFVRAELQTQKITVQTGLGTQLPLVLANKGQLQQVILNLVRNAADAMNAVSDRARVLRVKSTIHDPDSVLLSLEDSGTGIDPKDIERIFDSFFTTKADGMGMGLSICRSIIEAHKGRLWASAGIGRGSVLNIQLPAAKPGSSA